MGGFHCEIPWKAIVQFREVPNQRKELKILEQQIREAMAVPSIYDGLVEHDKAQIVCATLVKTSLSRDDIVILFEAGESLWESYPPP